MKSKHGQRRVSLYQVKIKKAALRQINALPGRYRQRVRAVIADLAKNPLPPMTKLLRGKQNIYRIAIDHYRIVYSIEDDILLVEVINVGPKAGPEFYANV